MKTITCQSIYIAIYKGLMTSTREKAFHYLHSLYIVCNTIYKIYRITIIHIVQHAQELNILIEDVAVKYRVIAGAL